MKPIFKIYIYEEGDQPCAYCWNPPEDWNLVMYDVDFLPYGNGWQGLQKYTHPECEEMVHGYMEEREREGWM